MQRIGIAASKMSKGCLLKYNLYVILICCLFSLLIFLICGFSILPIVFLISLMLHSLKPVDFTGNWVHMFKICLLVLAGVIGLFNIVAIFKNIQLSKSSI